MAAPWYTTDTQAAASTSSIRPTGGSGSAQHVRFVSGTGATGVFLLGSDGTLNGNTALWISADVRLTYNAASYSGTTRRNLIGVYGLAGTAEQGFAGISLSGSLGVVAEVKELSASTQTRRTIDSALTGTWHRVELEITFDVTNGKLRSWVDGKPQQAIGDVGGVPTVSAAVDGFSFWVGANAEGPSPEITADYDNVSVRYGVRP